MKKGRGLRARRVERSRRSGPVEKIQVCPNCGDPRSPKAILCRPCRDRASALIASGDRWEEDLKFLLEVGETSQAAVARRMGVSRSAVSSRIKRIEKRTAIREEMRREE